MRKWPFLFASVPLALLPAFACSSSETPTGEPIAKRIDPIINGYQDTDKNNDAVVAIASIEGQYITDLCTGALIAPNVVLTARHCVSKVNGAYVDCQNDVAADKDPSSMIVARGFTALENPQGMLSYGKQIIHDHNSSLCGHDLALLILEEDNVLGSTPAQPEIVPLRVRVSNGPTVGETFTAVGYGLTNPNDENSAGARYRRDGVRVTGFEPGTGDVDFVGTQSICSGDSGGPAISAQGAVMGVTSRGSDCYGNWNIWTRTDRFKYLLDQAIKAAGTTYTGEDGTVYDGTSSTGGTGGTGGSGGSGGSSGTGGSSNTPSACPPEGCPGDTACVDAFHGQYCASPCNGGGCPAGYFCADFGYCLMNESCAVAEDCATGTVCVDDGGFYCAPTCDASGACPAGFSCAQETGICFKTKATGSPYDGSSSDSGCSVSGSQSSSGVGWLAALAGVALLLGRRRH